MQRRRSRRRNLILQQGLILKANSLGRHDLKVQPFSTITSARMVILTISTVLPYKTGSIRYSVAMECNHGVTGRAQHRPFRFDFSGVRCLRRASLRTAAFCDAYSDASPLFFAIRNLKAEI